MTKTDLVTITSWGLVAVELLGGLSGLWRWRRSNCAHKIITGYLLVSFGLGLAGQVLPLCGMSNIWLGHLWILITTICMGSWILKRSRDRYARHAIEFWGLAVWLWLALACWLGILEYYPYAQLYMSVLGLSGVLCSRHCSQADKALAIAFSAEILLCAVSMYWHARVPAFWAVRNLAWIWAYWQLSRNP